MAELSEDERREQYNGIRDAAEPLEVFVPAPESLPVAKSFDDFKRLSDLVLSAWDHAQSIGRWFYDHDKSTGLPGDVEQWETKRIAKSIVGLRVILEALYDVDTRGDFSIFNTAMNPSVHALLLEQAREQYKGLEVLSGSFRLTDYEWMCELAPKKFAELCGRLNTGIWFEPDRKKHSWRVRAELNWVKAAIERRDTQGNEQISDITPPEVYETQFHELLGGIDLDNNRVKWRGLSLTSASKLFLLFLKAMCEARLDGQERQTMKHVGIRNVDLQGKKLADILKGDIEPRLRELIESPGPSNTRAGYKLRFPSEVLLP